jgi:hypothetical protein
LELSEELLAFIQGPTDSHVPAVDNKAEIDHEVGDMGIPFVIL